MPQRGKVTQNVLTLIDRDDLPALELPGFAPATSSAPFVATLVDVTGPDHLFLGALLIML